MRRTPVLLHRGQPYLLSAALSRVQYRLPDADWRCRSMPSVALMADVVLGDSPFPKMMSASYDSVLP